MATKARYSGGAYNTTKTLSRRVMAGNSKKKKKKSKVIERKKRRKRAKYATQKKA